LVWRTRTGSWIGILRVQCECDLGSGPIWIVGSCTDLPNSIFWALSTTMRQITFIRLSEI
jgi:hypothetical protein